MIKTSLKKYLSIGIILSLKFQTIFAGNFLPANTPTSSIGGDSNINSTPLIGVANVGDSSIINSIAIDSNNRIVAAGSVNVGFNTNWILARFNSNGSLDTTFNANGPQPGVVVTNAFNPTIESGLNTGLTTSIGNQEINSVVIDNNNKIVVAGFVNDGTNDFFAVGRYNSNGTLDTTFSPSGAGTNVPGILITILQKSGQTTNARATAAIIDSNNKIVVTGNSQVTATSLPLQIGTNSTDIALIRYNNNGSLDTTLNPGGALSGQPGVVLTNVTGSSQTTITGNNNLAFAITIDNEERILVGGYANISVAAGLGFVAETTGSLVIRYNPNGSLDTTFNASGIHNGPPGSAITVVNSTDSSINNSNIVRSIKIDNNNKIVLMGYSTFVSNDAGLGTDIFIIRYDENSAFDISFNPGALLPPFIEGIITTDIPGHPLVANGGFIDNNNKIVVGGWTTNALSNFEVSPVNTGEVDFLVVRYLPSGALDGTFNHLVTPGFAITSIPSNSAANGVLPNAKGRAIALDNENNIVLAGYSSSGPEQDFTIARYTNAGVLDTTNFNPNGLISTQPGVVILNATGGTNPFNTLGVTLSLTTMTDVINLDKIIVDPQRAAKISSFFVGFRRPMIEAPEDIYKYDDSELILNGTAQPSSTIYLTINGIPSLGFQVSTDGSWNVKLPPLPDGDYNIYATSTDPESHLMLMSNPVNVKVEIQKNNEPPIDNLQENESLTPERMAIPGSAELNAPDLSSLNSKFIAKTISNTQVNTKEPVNRKLIGRSYGLDQVKTNAPGINEEIETNYAKISASAEPVAKSPSSGTEKKSSTNIRESNNENLANDKVITINGKSGPQKNINLFVNGQHLANLQADQQGRWNHPIDLNTIPEGENKVQYALVDKDNKTHILVEKTVNLNQ